MPQRHRGGVQIQPHLLLTLVFTSLQYPTNRELGSPQNRSGHLGVEIKSLPLLRFTHRPSSTQSSRYMGCTIPDPQSARTCQNLNHIKYSNLNIMQVVHIPVSLCTMFQYQYLCVQCFNTSISVYMFQQTSSFRILGSLMIGLRHNSLKGISSVLIEILW